MIVVMLIRLGLDGGRARAMSVGASLPEAIRPARPGDDVQRRAQLMGDAGGQPAHGLQPVGMAKLLQGGKRGRRIPRGLLACDSAHRGAHRVETVGQFGQFVVRAEMRPARSSPRRRCAALRDQPRSGAPRSAVPARGQQALSTIIPPTSNAVRIDDRASFSSSSVVGCENSRPPRRLTFDATGQ